MDDEELNWLYADPLYYCQGIGRHLVRAAVRASSRPLSLEVLLGNEAALALYLSEGYVVIEQTSGRLAGNEDFAACAYVLRYCKSRRGRDMDHAAEKKSVPELRVTAQPFLNAVVSAP